MNEEAKVDHYFTTPIWVFEKEKWVNKVNKVCDKYIKEAYKRDKKGKDDFGHSYHSSPLFNDRLFYTTLTPRLILSAELDA